MWKISVRLESKDDEAWNMNFYQLWRFATLMLDITKEHEEEDISISLAEVIRECE